MTEEELRQIIIRIQNNDHSENWVNYQGALAELQRRYSK